MAEFLDQFQESSAHMTPVCLEQRGLIIWIETQRSRVREKRSHVLNGAAPPPTVYRLRSVFAIIPDVIQELSSLTRNRHNLPIFTPGRWPLRAIRSSVEWLTPKNLATSLTFRRGSNSEIVLHGLAFIFIGSFFMVDASL
jgi:hypothetical protein